MRLKRKTRKVDQFIDNLHEFIVNDRSFRKKTLGLSETRVQSEIRPLILDFLKRYFKEQGVVDYEAKAHKSFYWEGQEGKHRGASMDMFGSYNYPDFHIREPFNVAIEYKQAPTGSLVKQGIGQSMMLTLSGEYDFVYYLFHDQGSAKKINESAKRRTERSIIQRLWDGFNIKLKVV